MTISVNELARTIDHALLTPTATTQDITKACLMGVDKRIASVCVRPSDVVLAASLLAGSETRTGTVLGFPHGTTSTAGKAAEARQAIEDGAAELDMVLNIGRLLSGDLVYVEKDVATISQLAHQHGLLLKVIFETCFLSREQKIAACEISSRAGADFVKTSTGFASGGATLADICLMRDHTPPGMGIKASGGIRDLDTMLAMMACGATRIGTSSTEILLAEAQIRSDSGSLERLTYEEASNRSTGLNNVSY